VNIAFIHKLAKAAFRRLVWWFNRILKFINLSIIILDIENVRGLSLSKRASGEEIAIVLKKFRPVLNGWPLVLVGGSKDGGYLLPADLSNIGRCMSAGCDMNWSFEKSLFSSFSITSSILDSEDKRPRDLDERHHYTPKWLGEQVDNKTITFDAWIEEFSFGTNLDLILQMDIEGFEWQAILDIDEKLLQRFRIMSIEFHGTQNFYNRRLLSKVYAPAIDKLLTYFDVVHVHPNNCCGLHKFGSIDFPNVFEVTFHRKDRTKEILGYADLPNALDVKNVESNAEIFISWPS
jgi:hypothetical protein